MSTSSISQPEPPLARREENRFILAGKVDDGSNRGPDETLLLNPPREVKDPYGWMRDDKRENQEVLDHLKAENDYTTALTSHLSDLRKALYNEMIGSIQETDFTTPTPWGEYVYYSRTFKGKSYKTLCRAPRSAVEGGINWSGEPHDVIVEGEVVYQDENLLAEGKDYCGVHSVTSPSQKLLAYSADFVGGETYQLYIKDIESGDILEDLGVKFEIDASIEWGKNDSTLYYLKMDEAHRPYQVWKHTLGESVEKDELLFEEKDELFWVGIDKSQDERYLFIDTSSKETSEILYVDLLEGDGKPKHVAKRRKKVLYDVEHRNGKFYISTNYGGTPNKKLMVCDVSPDCGETWVDAVDENGEKMFNGSYERALYGVTPFKNHLVATGREGGIPRVWIIKFDHDGSTILTSEQLVFDEDAYDVGLGGNYEFDSDVVRVSYDSLVTPLQTIEVSMVNQNDRKVLKQKAVPGYDRTLYACERSEVLARDGKTKIPVSILYRKADREAAIESESTMPLHLYGYGSYGSSMEAYFSASRLSLLNRGMVYVIAHVRGGGEMGRHWYEEPNGAKYLCKRNTFDDFVDVARHVIDCGLTEASKMSCEGRSAGGLLIGAVINQAPELFKAAILGVPFVDVVPTMIDASIPLTVAEWEEWGNPNEAKFFDYMMSYSPINNVKVNAKYPSCLLTGGLHDPRVQFWEPSKFAAELRHGQAKTSGPVCLKIDMTAGHFSASDRYKYLKELAFDYAFMLDQLGLVEK